IFGPGNGRRRCVGPDRCRNSVGTDGRLLRPARDAAPGCGTAAQGIRADGFPHRHGRSPQRPGVETPTQSAHYRKQAGDRPYSAGIRRAAVGRARQADGAMTRLFRVLCAALLLCAAAEPDAPSEPSDYRMSEYRAPTPATLRGALVLTTDQAHAL